MPVSAVSSMFFHEYTLREIFSFVQKAGLSGLEFWLETPDFWLRNRPAGTVLACRREFSGMETFTLHAPVLDLNPCSINPDVAAVSIDHAVSAIRLADELGAGIVTVHPGRRTVKRPPSTADFERFGRYITALREEARKHRLKVAMENMEPAVNSLLCTPQRVRELLDEEAWLSFTLDVSHALAGRPGDCGEYIRLCGDRLVNVHLSRADRKRLHLPLDNSPAMAEIIGSLCDAGYDGPLTLEIDDLTFDRMLPAEEKIAMLAKNATFISSACKKPR